MERPTFVDFVLDRVDSVTVYRRSIVVTKDGTRIVFKGRSYSQLARLVNMSRSNVVSNPDRFKKALIERVSRKPLMLRCLVMFDGALYVVRATSDSYVAVPHRILVDAVSRFLEAEPDHVKRFSARTVFLWRVVTVFDNVFYVAVSNANTGVHSIKVYPIVRFAECGNEMLANWMATSVRTVHRGELRKVLLSVIRAVDEVVAKLSDEATWIIDSVSELARIELSPQELDDWIEGIAAKVPRYVAYILRSSYRRFVQKHGYSLATAFQSVTRVVAETRNYDVFRDMSRLASEMLLEKRLPGA